MTTAQPRLNDLTVPEPGSTTTRSIWSAALRSRIRALPRLHVQDLAPGLVGQYRDMVRRLASVGKASPGALASVVRRPNVGTLIGCLRDPKRADVNRPVCVAQLIAAVGYELVAMECVLDTNAGLDVETWCSWVHRGRVHLTQGELALQTSDEHGPLFAPVTATTWLVRADDNPLSHNEAHPDKSGNAVDLGDRSIETWCAALRAALELIAEHTPTLRADIDIVLQQVVPVGYDAEQHLSASYAENLGTAYLSLHDDPLTMAEALIHEVSHNKLNALLELRPLLHNAFEPLYASPVRPDPRPLHGVLLAVHAFAAVAELLDELRKSRHPLSQTPTFERRHAQVSENNREGLAVLEAHAEPTPTGDALLTELTRLIG